MDSTVGMIWRDGGVRVQYDIGEDAGNYTECKWCGWTDGELWRTRQTIDGQTAVCVFTKKQTIVVSFLESHANFHATVRNSRDMADSLLVILSYRAPK